MTVKMCVIVFFFIITLLLAVVSIRSIHRPPPDDKPSKIIIIVLTAISTITTFAVPWALPKSIANTKIEYLDGHVTINQPAVSDESTLLIEGFQVTGDSSKGIAYIKFHISSNFHLLNGSITLSGAEEAVTVGYNIPSATCTSTTSNKNFAVRFPDMKSEAVYTAEIVAEDISGNILSLN